MTPITACPPRGEETTCLNSIGNLMANLPEKSLDELRAKGLLVLAGFEPDHIAYPNGYWVGKPTSIPGNTCPRGEELFVGDLDDDNRPIIDAPILVLYSKDERYFVELRECFTNPGLGDFVNEWPTIDEAIADIFDYYFGDSTRMDAKRKAWEKSQKAADDWVKRNRKD